MRKLLGTVAQLWRVYLDSALSTGSGCGVGNCQYRLDLISSHPEDTPGTRSFELHPQPIMATSKAMRGVREKAAEAPGRPEGHQHPGTG